jgi:DICT domain-containing protein
MEAGSVFLQAGKRGEARRLPDLRDIAQGSPHSFVLEASATHLAEHLRTELIRSPNAILSLPTT